MKTKEPRLLGPGVFIAPYLALDGCPVLIALDSQSRLRRQKRFRADQSEQEQIRQLEGLLNLIEPSPRKKRA